jgi:hypothetical protein
LVGAKNHVKLQNSWASESCLGVDIFLEGLGLELRLLNVYGPYSDRITFWDTLFKKNLLKEKPLILGGDLNLSLGNVEVWGPSARPDPLYARFSHLFNDMGFIDLPPVKLPPTW